MDNREPDIISKQTSVITVLCAIVLILTVLLFFLGYCEPRHVKMNEAASSASTEQGAASAAGAGSGSSAGTQTDDAAKKDTAQSK